MSELSKYRITDNDVAQHGVIAAPDRLTGTAAQNKAVFDRLIRDAVKEKYNALLEAVGDELGAVSVWEPYDAEKEYVPGNKVIYNGSSYLCAEACTGVLPTNAAYWRLIAAHGKDGTGAGDMCADVYDPRGIEADVFAYVDRRTDAYGKNLLPGDVTYYVDAASGDDANDGLSEEAPLKTIMAAVNRIPKVLNGHIVTIHVASGSYIEILRLVGFTNGQIRINGPEMTISGVEAHDISAYVDLVCKSIIYNAAFGASYALVTTHRCDLTLRGNDLLLQNNGASCGVLSYGGNITINESSMTVKDCDRALLSSSGAVFIVQVDRPKFENCSIAGVNAYAGMIYLMRDPVFTNTPTKYYTGFGGHIYMNAQTSVLNY